jgi:adenylosuccinate lyase
MVPRYSRPAMVAIWEPEAKYRIWFEIEAHATEKLGELGVVPPSAAKALWDWWQTNPAIDVDAIDAIGPSTTSSPSSPGSPGKSAIRPASCTRA